MLRAAFDPKQTFVLHYDRTIDVTHSNDSRYKLEDFSNFDEGRRSIASHSRNEKNRPSPMKQKKYTANCAMPVVGQKPALFINAIVQKTLNPVAIAFICTCFVKIFMEVLVLPKSCTDKILKKFLSA